ncbi:MORN repeat variant [Kordia sp. SMS9]|uniref:toxin-antitoxin system YwqK family antitoxin n=1 Tax=Kordia sp. SMS9 TaxID=2282170 RepID=UPI000E0CE3F0|nr:toxin-antitoxin system YwqK family antitoxin [Kordia sp. SMS9]AXG69749.1 MORN repeat variant [Kordia sp. SMS9]
MIQKVVCILAVFFVFSSVSIAQDSLFIKLDRKNRVKELGTIQHGKKNGLFFKFKSNGKHKSYFYKNGKKRTLAPSEVSVETQYDPKSRGQILGECFGVRKNERRTGLWLFFDNDKQFIAASRFENDFLEGNTYYFHADGEVMRMEQYAKGKKHGISEEFHAGGALHYRIPYKNDKIADGEHVYYYPNGNKKIVNTYKNGKKFGKSTTYYESGAKEIEGEYRDKGLAEGPWKEYYENGTLKEEYYYKHGLFHGEYIIYDENGKVVEQYIYKNDKLIKTILN